jgi:hypothetical protein
VQVLVALDFKQNLAILAIAGYLWFEDWPNLAALTFSFGQVVCRLSMLRFHYRQSVTAGHKRPATLRVEHSAYGSVAQKPNYLVLKSLFVLFLVTVTLVCSYMSYGNYQDLLDLGFQITDDVMAEFFSVTMSTVGPIFILIAIYPTVVLFNLKIRETHGTFAAVGLSVVIAAFWPSLGFFALLGAVLPRVFIRVFFSWLGRLDMITLQCVALTSYWVYLISKILLEGYTPNIVRLSSR